MLGSVTPNTLFHMRNNTARLSGEFTYGDDFSANVPAITLFSGEAESLFESVVSVRGQGDLKETDFGHAVHARDAQLDLRIAVPVADDPCFTVDQFHPASPLFLVCSNSEVGLYSCDGKLILDLRGVS